MDTAMQEQESRIQINGGAVLGGDFRKGLGEFKESGCRQSNRDESRDGVRVHLDALLYSSTTTLHPQHRAHVSVGGQIIASH